MRVVFMGTPDFAVPSLRALEGMDEVEIVGVFTQPDRPVGRGHKLEMPPVKREALENGLNVFQFERVRKQEGLDAMRALKPDLVVTAAFGQILSKKLLEVPRMGTVNVHASLLPRHRGAAPINWCLIQGEKVTGVTTMLTDAGLDTGDMLLKKEVEIGENETAGELTERLAQVGAELLAETIRRYAAGEIAPVKQNEAEMTYEPLLTKELGRIDWTQDAADIVHRIHGLNPWPGCTSAAPGGTWKLLRAEVADMSGQPGEVLAADGKEGLIVAAGKNAVRVRQLQVPGGKPMDARDYLRGHAMAAGTILKEDTENE